MRREAHDEPRARRGRSRALIVDGARHAFLERGYVATTMEGIAERAGVAVQTVYYVFGTKHAVLAAVLDASIVGDHDEVPLAGRDWLADLDGITDVAAAFTHVVASCAAILARTAPIYDVVCRASSDPEVERLYLATREHRRADQRAIVDALGRGGHLRADVEPDAAADTFYALVNEETYTMLTVDCSWPLEQFEGWLDDVLRRLLARPAVVPPRRPRRPRAGPRR